MLKITSEVILTAGPTIKYKEKEYTFDAVVNGWNHHHSDYIKKFEVAFADYIGVKYALATSSCTGALHLALMAFGIGPGDEVIVPDTSWIATVSAVKYVGATPVFADINPETWVLDENRIERHITKKTKAIIPVHLYGNPVIMEPIYRLAEKHGFVILEDAAPSIGAIYNGKKTGSLGRAAAFSFQGAKALVTGEGGMFVTDDRVLYDRVRFLGDHGRDPNRALASIEIGYKYKMSNIQAALGLAQTERAEEIVAKKRQIFGWYKERLSDIEYLKLNVEKPGTRNICWMSSLVLPKDYKVTREEFMKKLKERKIDTRPFFYPISSFPMFKGVSVDNPVAYDIPQRAVNLPSGHDRTEEEIDYICAHIRDILGEGKNSKINPVQPSGWLAYRDMVNDKLVSLKKEGAEANLTIEIKSEGDIIGGLRPVTYLSLISDIQIQKLAKWRDGAQAWFPSQFKVTHEGTKRWLEKGLLEVKDRVLFYVEDNAGNQVGHVGLFRFDYINKACEIDNIVRGEQGIFPGAIKAACKAMLGWAFDELGIQTAYLRVVSDNERAIKLYESIGYREIQRVPLMQIKEGDMTRWIEVLAEPYREINRYFVTMKLTKKEWMENNA